MDEMGLAGAGIGMSLPRKILVNSPGASFASEGGGGATGVSKTLGVVKSRVVSVAARLSWLGAVDD
jgi:hypothetical protein